MGEPPPLPTVQELQSLVDNSRDGAPLRRPMNAFLIFCKKHRTLVREKNPHLDNRSVTRILGELWANLPYAEKDTYLTLAKQYRDAFMKANPDFHWHGNKKEAQGAFKPANKVGIAAAKNTGGKPLVPGKLADPSNMGGLGMLLIAGNHSANMDTKSSSGAAFTGLPGHMKGSGPPGHMKGSGPQSHMTGSGPQGHMTGSGPPGHMTGSGLPGHMTGSGPPGHMTGSGPPGHMTGSGPPGHMTGSGPPGHMTGSGPQSQMRRPPVAAVDNIALLQLAEMCSSQLESNSSSKPPVTSDPGSYAMTPPWTPQYEGHLSPSHDPTTLSPSAPTTAGELEAHRDWGPLDLSAKPTWNQSQGRNQSTSQGVFGAYPTFPSSTQSVTAASSHVTAAAVGSSVALAGAIARKFTKTNGISEPMPSGRMIVDRMIETVFTKEMLHDQAQNPANPATQNLISEDQRKRSNSMSGGNSGEYDQLFQSTLGGKQGPMTFGEIQETLIRKAMEDSEVLNLNNRGASLQQPRNVPAGTGLNYGGRVFKGIGQPSGFNDPNIKPDASKLPLNMGHMGMDLAVRNTNFYTGNPPYTSDGKQPGDGIPQFVPVVLPGSDRGNLQQPSNFPQSAINAKSSQSLTHLKAAFAEHHKLSYRNNNTVNNNKNGPPFNESKPAVDLVCRENIDDDKMPVNSTAAQMSNNNYKLPSSQQVPMRKSRDPLDLLCREELSGYDSNEEKFKDVQDWAGKSLKNGGATKKPTTPVFTKIEPVIKAESPEEISLVCKEEDLDSSPNPGTKVVKTEQSGWNSGSIRIKQKRKCDESSSAAVKVENFVSEGSRNLPPKKRGGNVQSDGDVIISQQQPAASQQDKSAAVREKKPRRRRRNVIEMTLDPYGERINDPPLPAGPSGGGGGGSSPEGGQVASSGGKTEDGGSGENGDEEEESGVRKSKRRNRGQKYQELLSKGLLQVGRHKRTESTSETGESECAPGQHQSLATAPGRRRGKSESVEGKLQSFDLDAEIASLPACHIDSPRDHHLFSHRLHPSTHSKQPHSAARRAESLQCKHTQVKSQAVKKLNIAELNQLTRAAASTVVPVSTTGGATCTASLSGSQKRKARSRAITRLVEVSKTQTTTSAAPPPVQSSHVIATTPAFSSLVDAAVAENNKLHKKVVPVPCT